MNVQNKTSLIKRIKNLFFGKARDLSEPGIFHSMSLIAFFAWVGLGADGITSSCYGPEEAFLALGQHIYLAVFVTLATIVTIFIISASYHQIIELFPMGGGGYLVASRLLSPSMGMISGSALLIDYLLTITLSMASGADALFSFLPAYMLPYKLSVAVAGVMILVWMNLRGVKESVMPLVPIFIVFIVTHVFFILYAGTTHISSTPQIMTSAAGDVSSTTTELGIAGSLFLIMKAYSMGAGTFTGIEAVSNGIPILREPRVKTARRTMNYMSFSLAFMVGGLMLSYLLFHVHHIPGKTLNAALFETITSSWGRAGSMLVLVTLLSEALMLFVASQTGFLDGPRVLANMALDRWMPARFSSLNDRLVTQNGILIMGIGSIILMIYSHGSVKFLVVLYSINVFITFSLSQLGMVRHWWQERKNEKLWKSKIFINGIGLTLTTFILVSVAIIKFSEGGWLTIAITGSIVIFGIIIKRHYKRTGKLLERLNGLVDLATMELDRADEKAPGKDSLPGSIDYKEKTAVLFVNGFSGPGLHALYSIIRLFGGLYQNFVFVQIGVVDSGVFKGADEMDKLKKHIEGDAAKYTMYISLKGYNATTYTSVGTDMVDESVSAAQSILKEFPNAVFFAGQIVFPEDTFFSRWLHNYSAFAIQRRFYHMGIPIVILPIRARA